MTSRSMPAALATLALRPLDRHRHPVVAPLPGKLVTMVPGGTS